MHRSTSALLAAFFVSVTVCLVGPVQAEIITEPTDLSVGEQYRLVFVTSGSRDATSTDIEDYNSFVDGHGDFAIASDWKVIGSTDLSTPPSHGMSSTFVSAEWRLVAQRGVLTLRKLHFC